MQEHVGGYVLLQRELEDRKFYFVQGDPMTIQFQGQNREGVVQRSAKVLVRGLVKFVPAS